MQRVEGPRKNTPSSGMRNRSPYTDAYNVLPLKPNQINEEQARYLR